MKRFHVHLLVDDLDTNVRFYSTVFGTSPTVLKPDYAKWMLEEPRVNFAISSHGVNSGVDHLGIQVESEAELNALHERLANADIVAHEQKNAICCYARSDKYWINDPQGLAWEAFHSLESAPVYGDTTRACCGSGPADSSKPEKSRACCA